MKKEDSRVSKTQMPNRSITDLHSTIFTHIMLRSSPKAVAACKCVCKTWLALISDPLFAKDYSAQSKTHTLIRDTHYTNIARTLYFFEPDRGSEFKDLYCRGVPTNETEVKARLKIPFRNFQLMLDRIEGNDDGDENETKLFALEPADGERKDLIVLTPSEYPAHVLSNSCNGFLCLSKAELSLGDDRVVVCNPITGEFLYLPQIPSCGYDDVMYSNCAFGFSLKHNQYKVIKMITRWRIDPVTGANVYLAVPVGIITVGDSLWRSVDSLGFELQLEERPSYLNGALYWISEEIDDICLLVSFDLDDEKFETHSIPPWPRQDSKLPQLHTEVVGGHLYLYNTEAKTQIDIWVASEVVSWTHLFSIDVSQIQERPEWSTYEILCCLSKEEVVLFGGPRNEFIYYDQSGGLRFKQLMFRGGLVSNFVVINFTPSFVSLKDIGLPSSIEVFNVNTVNGYEKLKLLEETYPLVLGRARN